MEPLLGLYGQFAMPLDGKDLRGKFGQNRCRIARTRADLQNTIRRFDLGRFDHSCNDERLRDRLSAADRQRTVLIGEFLKPLVYERLAWDSSQR